MGIIIEIISVGDKVRVGEIKRGRDIGKSRKHIQYIYLQCPSCKKERWADYTYYKKCKNKLNTLCSACNGRSMGKINKGRFNW
jgi:hypothetical protein